MPYTADGVLGADSYDVLHKRITLLQARLSYAEQRYNRLRGLVDFYHTLGANDAGAQILTYRQALQAIVDLAPSGEDIGSPQEMAAIAKAALGQ